MQQALSEQAEALWAKKRVVDSEPLWLPLIVHLVDTGRTIEDLFDHWLTERQREVIAGGLNKEDARKLVRFIGFTHDLGKATFEFQIKPSRVQSGALDEAIFKKLESVGFENLRGQYQGFSKHILHASAGEQLLRSFGTPMTVAAVIGAHHGEPLVNLREGQIREYPKNYWQDKNPDRVQRQWQAVQSELFDYGLSFGGYPNVSDIPNVGLSQAVLLNGLLIMADWLSSSENRDPMAPSPLFPLVGLETSFGDIALDQRFEQAKQNWPFNDDWKGETITPDTSYQSRFGFKPRPIQKRFSQLVSSITDPGIIIIEAPMGVGKTEMALVAAEQLAAKTGQKGLFFGLPTQATSDAMFARVSRWLIFLAHEGQQTFSVELVHGKAKFNQVYQRLPIAHGVDTEANGHDGAVVVNHWFSGKKRVLDSFSIGTVDHLIVSGLKQKHLALRHLGMSHNIVIIDEVHGYDGVMLAYLGRTLEWLGAYHVPVVVLSATLPKSIRNQLLKSYFHGRYARSMEKLADFSQVSDDWQQDQRYPLISWLDGKKLNQASPDLVAEDQSKQKIHVIRSHSDSAKLVHTILSKIKQSGIAGVIVNTIGRAQDLAKQFPSNIPVILVHSALLAPERAKREAQLEAAIGNHSKRPAQLVVIGTQVLEQSLDIDFDVLFTDLAPMDALLQRFGRLHRHPIRRPPHLTNAEVVIMGLNEDNHYRIKSQRIYDDYLMSKTDALLPASIILPDDIGPLVQTTYDLSETADIKDATSLLEVYLNQREVEEHEVETFMVGKPIDRQTKFREWIISPKAGVSQNEAVAISAVRASQPSLEVILLQQGENGFQLIDGTPLIRLPATEIAEQTIRLPTRAINRYDRAVTQLRRETQQIFPDWHESIYLQDALALILDSHRDAILDGRHLHYSHILGLQIG